MSGVLSVDQPLSEALNGGCRIVSSGKSGLDTFQLGVGLQAAGVEASTPSSKSCLNMTFNAQSAGMENTASAAPVLTPAPAPIFQQQYRYS